MASEQKNKFPLRYLSPEQKKRRKEQKFWHMRCDQERQEYRMASLNDLIASRVPLEKRTKKKVKKQIKTTIKKATTTTAKPKHKAKYVPHFKNSPLFRKAPPTKVKPSTLFKFQRRKKDEINEKSEIIKNIALHDNDDEEFIERDKQALGAAYQTTRIFSLPSFWLTS